MQRALCLVTFSILVSNAAAMAATLTPAVPSTAVVAIANTDAIVRRPNIFGSRGESLGETLWLHDSKPTAFAREALVAMADAPRHGLGDLGFNHSRLVVLRESLIQGSTEHAVAFNTEMTRAWTDFIAAMRPVHTVSRTRNLARRQSATILETIFSGGPRILYAGLIPTHPQYSALQDALAEYESGSIQILPIAAGEALEFGDFGLRVAALRNRLLGSRDLAYGEYERSYFDEPLRTAVVAYQSLHGLAADGIVGRGTLAHLNMSVSERTARIQATMQRWRELPTDFGPDYVQVNIPEYRLQMIRGGQERLNMRVVVGSQRNQTPEFSDEIEYLVLNPYWYVPRSIALEELLPKSQADPSYLARNGYDIFVAGQLVAAESVDWQALNAANFNVRIRQRPGPGNALGSVKFLLPNPQNIYLHDSPSRQLYARTKRAFSHGCIRLEYPLQFAEALLEQQEEWTGERISSSTRRGARKQVNLQNPLPVHLTYLTAKVTETGAVVFFDDVYGRDQRRVARFR